MDVSFSKGKRADYCTVLRGFIFSVCHRGSTSTLPVSTLAYTSDVVPPLRSAGSWGCCNSCGILQGPEWRNACWKKMEAVARGWKTVVEVGNHSCGRNVSSVLP